jgi:2-oxoglutarate ferredoxin oxidoreductase subunit alpha
LITRLNNKIIHNADKIIDVEEFMLDDAKIGVIAYGTPSRSAKKAIKDAREEGIKVGMLRLKTVWPFPEEQVAKPRSDVLHGEGRSITDPCASDGKTCRDASTST